MKNALISILILGLAAAVMGCATAKAPAPRNVDTSQPLKLRLVPTLGQKEKTQYHSRSVVRVYQNSTLMKKAKEELDFRVVSQVVSVEPVKNRINYVVISEGKQGDGDLREFAIPEPGEKLELLLNDVAEVFRAGNYPKDSIFYVPTMSLPADPVQVGDSWVQTSKWKSQNNSIPLLMELVSILKKYIPCGGEHCALIELSGEVKLDGVKENILALKSDVRGFLLFSIERGSVVWSLVRSDQQLHAGELKTDMKTCLTSYAVDPAVPGLKDFVTPYCRPEAEINFERDVPSLIRPK